MHTHTEAQAEAKAKAKRQMDGWMRISHRLASGDLPISTWSGAAGALLGPSCWGALLLGFLTAGASSTWCQSRLAVVGLGVLGTWVSSFWVSKGWVAWRARSVDAAWSGVPRLFPTAGCRGGRRMHDHCVDGCGRVWAWVCHACKGVSLRGSARVCGCGSAPSLGVSLYTLVTQSACLASGLGVERGGGEPAGRASRRGPLDLRSRRGGVFDKTEPASASLAGLRCCHSCSWFSTAPRPLLCHLFDTPPPGWSSILGLGS